MKPQESIPYLSGDAAIGEAYSAHLACFNRSQEYICITILFPVGYGVTRALQTGSFVRGFEAYAGCTVAQNARPRLVGFVTCCVDSSPVGRGLLFLAVDWRMLDSPAGIAVDCGLFTGVLVKVCCNPGKEV